MCMYIYVCVYKREKECVYIRERVVLRYCSSRNSSTVMLYVCILFECTVQFIQFLYYILYTINVCVTN